MVAKNTWDTMWASGLAADRPDAGDVIEHAYYFATDTLELSRSDGVSTWTTVNTFGTAAHTHAGEDITSGTVADARIAAAIARDSEVTSAIGTHEADTTSVHGITDTSTLYRSGGTDVAVADGGTGASTKAAGFDALSPMSASGDIIYGGASGTGTRLPKGSDGQVLKLASGLPSWAAAGSGDVATDAIWDAKGDLAGGTGANTAARLPVGSNGQVLTADSAETTGLKWATPAAGSGSAQALIGVAVTDASFALSNGSYVAIPFGDADTWDTDGFHDPSSNNTRLTVPAGLGGKYLLIARVGFPPGSGTDHRIGYRINGGSDNQLYRAYFANAGVTLQYGASIVLELAAGDYVEVLAYCEGTPNGSARAELVKLDSGKVGAGIGAKAVRSTSQTITTSTETGVAFNATDDFDTDGFHDPASNNTRVTVPAGLGGKYLITGFVSWTADTGGSYRFAYLRKNGTDYVASDSRPPAPTLGYSDQTVSTVVDLVPGDYFEVRVAQNKGADLDVVKASLSIMRLDSGSSGAKAHGRVMHAGNHAITGTSFADVDTTNESLSVTTSGGDLYVGWQGPVSSPGGGEVLYLDITVDGTRVSGVANGLMQTAAAQVPCSIFGVVTGLAAGAHTVRLQAKVSTGTGNLVLSGSSVGVLYAQEL